VGKATRLKSVTWFLLLGAVGTPRPTLLPGNSLRFAPDVTMVARVVESREPMQQNVIDLLQKYLQQPSRECFRSLQDAVVASPDYAPYGVSPDKAGPLFDQGKFAEAEALLRDMMGNFL
jgi:hypothetical protein